MASMATLNFHDSPSIRIHPNIPKALLPQCSNNLWLGRKRYVLANFQQTLHQTHKYSTIEGRVASSDVFEVSHKEGSQAEAPNTVNEVKDSVSYIKALLNTMDEGRISVSAYDTAWVAMIKDIDGGSGPQFPAALEWITEHQLSDGSWGDQHYFCAYDRIINTLACVVALTSWNVHPNMRQKGITYIRENVHKLENADAEHMLCGFEVILPSLLQQAQRLGIEDLPYDAPVVTAIQSDKARKMKKIPKDVMHKVPTSLLFSLEGLEDLEWQKLLKLQSPDGSFLTSPSSTAFAFMQTGDPNCLRFITNTVQNLNGGAPHTYPVDVFARLWAVDRLQRLGVSRYFEPEIKDILSYIFSVWTKKGVFSGRDSDFCDLDDTAMGFRLLRMYGYDMDPSVFENFKSVNKFSCYGGQIIESSSPIYNLYRASQFRFPGETILEEASDFAYNFLQEKLEKNELLDKWVIYEHFTDEIKIGLDMPWYATLPRVEAKYYLQHYAGGKDVWIGKTLYRMEEISNDAYLKLAKVDFKRCQEQHQIEWISMQDWYENSNAQEFGITRKDLLIAYFLSAATVFEPERSEERVTWAKSQIISRMITSFLKGEITTFEQKDVFLKQFENNIDIHKSKRGQGLNDILLAITHRFLKECNGYKSKQLKRAWGKWMMKLHQGGADLGEEAALLATTLNICAKGAVFNDEILFHDEYRSLSNLTNKICRQLSQIQSVRASNAQDWRRAKLNLKNMEVEHDMQCLVRLILQDTDRSGGIDRNIKQTFLSIVKTYYYGAYNSAETMDVHMFKVLFEPVA